MKSINDQARAKVASNQETYLIIGPHALRPPPPIARIPPPLRRRPLLLPPQRRHPPCPAHREHPPGLARLSGGSEDPRRLLGVAERGEEGGRRLAAPRGRVLLRASENASVGRDLV